MLVAADLSLRELLPPNDAHFVDDGAQLALNDFQPRLSALQRHCLQLDVAPVDLDDGLTRCGQRALPQVDILLEVLLHTRTWRLLRTRVLKRVFWRMTWPLS